MRNSKKEVLVGYTNEIYKVENVGNRFNLVNTAGEVETDLQLFHLSLERKLTKVVQLSVHILTKTDRNRFVWLI